VWLNVMSKCENMFGRAIVFLCECSWMFLCGCVRIVFLLCRFGHFILELDCILERFVDLNLWFGPLRGNSRHCPDRRTENEL